MMDGRRRGPWRSAPDGAPASLPHVPTLTDEAVCVRHWDFSETSQTVSLFTRHHGMLRGLAKGAKRERGRFSGGIDLLTRGEVIALVKPGRELSTLTDWDLLETFRPLRERLDANRAGFYMAELVCRMIVDGAPHQRSHDAFVAALRALADPAAVDAALLRFQWSLLDDGGVRPRLETHDGAAPVAFSARDGGVVAASASAGAWPVRRETIQMLRLLAEEDRIDPPTGEPVRRAARLLAAYIRELLGAEPSTMQAVFGEIAVGRREAR